MLAPLEMRILDRNARHFGISILDLMENAGRAVADVARKELGANGKRVLAACGTGNNGGDGLVAARHLSDDCRVEVLLARPPDQITTEEARTNFERLIGATVHQGLDASERAMERADLIIDALLGIGLEGPLREPYPTLIRDMNASGKPILSVDVPSGFGTNPIVRPTATVALHDAKEGMTLDNSGVIHVADIGIPPRVARSIGPGEFLLYPVPRADSHKGQNGRVLIVSGGPYTGAPALVAYGALGIGADLVHLAVPAVAAQVVASYSPTFIVHPIGGTHLLLEDVRPVVEMAAKADALAIGPGLGAADDTLKAVRDIVRSVTLPMVLDADAIRAIAAEPALLRGRRAVVTPHSREFRVLTGVELPSSPEERVEPVRQAAATLEATVLLKGPVDLVSDGARVKLNYTGNPGMTVGGTGDVLSGIVAGLLSKVVGAFDAARLAAFTNGYAGDLAFRTKSYGLTAMDVAEHIGPVLAEFLG